MTDQELADQLMLTVTGFADIEVQGPEKFVRDWRVAGALMTKCRTVNYSTTTTKGAFCHAHGKNDKHGASNACKGEEARAVIEACVEALTADLQRGSS